MKSLFRFLKKYRVYILGLASVVILYYLVNQVTFEEIKDVWNTANKKWLLLGCLWFVFWPILTTYRFYVLTNYYHKISFWASLKYNWVAMFYNNVIPSKGGDLLRAFSLKKNHNISIKDASMIVILDKIIDFHSLVAVIAIGLFFVPLNLIGIIGVLGYILGMIFLTYLFLKGYLSKIFQYIKIAKLEKTHNEALLFFRQINLKQFFQIFSLAVANNLGNYLQIWLFLLAFSIPLSYFENLYYSPVAMIIGMLPLSINGIGTRDAAFQYLLQTFAPSPNILMASFTVTLRTIVGGLLALFFAPREILFSSKAPAPHIEQ